MTDSHHRRLQAGLLVFVGLCCLPIVVGLLLLWTTAAFVKSAARTTGTVTEIELTRSNVRHYVYFPTITFADTDGKMHEFKVTWGSSEYAYEVGDTVPILFDPQDPSSFRIDKGLWTWPSFLMG